MSFVRSCYSTTARFFFDSADETPVLWYFVPEDWPTLPYETAFFDTVWSERDVEPPSTLGESYTNHVYSKGLPLPSRPIRSLAVCGSADQWLRGASINDPVPGFFPGSTVPTCCEAVTNLPAGGATVGKFGPFTSVCVPCTLPDSAFMTVAVNPGSACHEMDGWVIPLGRVPGACAAFGFTYQTLYQSPYLTIGGETSRFTVICLTDLSLPQLFWGDVVPGLCTSGNFQNAFGSFTSPCRIVWLNQTWVIGTCVSFLTFTVKA